jgi:hypothetical protein
MKKIFGFVFGLILSAGPLFSQENVSLCEKLFYAYKSSSDEFSYARGSLKDKIGDENSLYRVSNYDLKPSFMENTDFTQGGISVAFDKRPVVKRPFKQVELSIKTASLGKINGGDGDSAIVNRFLGMGGAVSQCLTGGTVEQAQLDDLEKITKIFKYVLFTKNVLNDRKLVEDSLCINNPYLEISLNRLMKGFGEYEAYFAVKIVHMTDL